MFITNLILSGSPTDSETKGNPKATIRKLSYYHYYHYFYRELNGALVSLIHTRKDSLDGDCLSLSR
jgi:hypothetical protein